MALGTVLTARLRSLVAAGVLRKDAYQHFLGGPEVALTHTSKGSMVMIKFDEN